MNVSVNALTAQTGVTSQLNTLPPHSDEFGKVFATEQTNSESLDQALDAFYQIHQRSQITGVPTAEYNAAVRALGLDPEQDPFAGINALEQKGYTIGMPTIGAILDYGATPQEHGNQSYLKQAENPESVQPNQPLSNQAIQLELQELDEAYPGLINNPTNYFDAVQQLAQHKNINAYRHLSLDQMMHTLKAKLDITTEQWLSQRQ
jgi:hypothetical protein